MHETKLALLKQYHHLTLELLSEMNPKSVDQIRTLLDDRENCIQEMKRLDQQFGSIIVSDEIKEQLISINGLESKLREKLQEEKLKVQANMSSVKREKTQRQFYGNKPIAHSGLFYDKRK